MDFEIVTLFPELFTSIFEAGLLGKAVKSGIVRVHFTNPRDFSTDRHRSVDDSPYGGGPGMVMMAPPLLAAIDAATGARGAAHRILLSPAGAPLTTARVRELAKLPRVLLVCGRYEGIDERVRELAIDEELSLGDFVLTGGELGAASIIDACARYLPGVLGEATSTDEESFSAGLLEYPHYTRPPEVAGKTVPDVLLGGDHAKVGAWRHQQSLERTRTRRPDLWARRPEAAATPPAALAALAARTSIALVHHPVYNKHKAIVATAITNLDLHDLARAARTFGLGRYYVITPVTVQRELAQKIIGHWTEGEGLAMNDTRGDALSLVRTAESVEQVIDAITAERGQRPYVVATAARGHDHQTLGFSDLVAARQATDPGRPMLVLFGTGHGLADEVFSKVDATLAPIKGVTSYNHLSVRAAAAIVCDRLFGLGPK